MSRTTAIVAAATVGLTLCLIGALAVGGGVISGAAGCAPPTATPSTTSPPSAGGSTQRWDAEQVGHATTIVAVGQQQHVPPRGWIVALATAMQESGLRNLAYGDRDSLGLFQQRPSQGWGTPDQILEPEYAAGAFYDKLVTNDDWEQMPVTEAAQAVQRSAYPGAYSKWEADAVALAAQITGTAPELLAACGAGGWVLPVEGPIVSGFRTEQRPHHDGIDIAAAKGAPVRAASAGTAVTVRCNAHLPDGSPYSCDVDGSPSVRGCGWYIDLQHSDATVTRYCHLASQPLVEEGDQVQAGQVIGEVGSSGHSSGPHLHLETHTSYPATSSNAVEPTHFFAIRGLAIG